MSVSHVLTGVANSINGPKYPIKVLFASIQFNVRMAVMHTCRKVTITRRQHQLLALSLH